MNRPTFAAADHAHAHALGAGWADDRARKFRKAARHSRLIRVLRVAIPAAIVAACGLVVVVTFFNPFRLPPDAAIDPGKLVVSGSKITMEAPRLAGFTNDRKPYELTAQSAAQDLAKPTVLELTELRAKVESNDQGAVTLQAATGTYDTKADLLRLVDKIVVRTGKGFEAKLSEAVVDVKKGTIVSEAPVMVTLPDGTVAANRLDISDGGGVVLFSRGVRTNLTFGGDRSRSASAQ